MPTFALHVIESGIKETGDNLVNDIPTYIARSEANIAQAEGAGNSGFKEGNIIDILTAMRGIVVSTGARVPHLLL